MTETGFTTMLDLIELMSANLEAGAGLEGLGAVSPVTSPAGGVLICGMGGSAIAGDLLAPVAASQGLRIAVWRDYGLPGWVRDDTLVILSSYSGNTEETLSAAREAAARGCPLYAITSGGELARYAADGIAGGAPFNRITLPGTLPPRAALGYGLGAQANLLSRLGLLAGIDAEIESAVATLRDGVKRLGPASADDSPAKAAARLILGRMLVVYTTSEESHA